MYRRIVPVIVSLPLFALSCASTDSSKGSTHASVSDDAGPGGDDLDASEKVQKKERELARSRLELKIARQKAEGENREAKNKLDDASFEVEKTTKERDNFKTVEQALKTA